MTYLDRANKLCQMIGEGQSIEAVDAFYADNIVIIEADGNQFEGAETQKGRIKEWQASLKEFHGGGVYAVTSNEEAGVTMIESWFDITFQDGNRVKFEEVAVQTWEGDRIVRERFYYNMPG